MRITPIVSLLFLATAACGSGISIPSRDGGSGDAGLGQDGAAGDGGMAGDGGIVPDAGRVPDGGVTRTCAELRADYLSELASAKLCNTASLVNPCTTERPRAIECGCPTWINAGSGGKLDELIVQFNAQGCGTDICPAIACVNPGTGSCLPSAGNPSQGTCTDVTGP